MTEPTNEELDAVIKDRRTCIYPQDMHPRFERAIMRDAIAKWGTPQPTHAQAGAVPLSIAEEERMLAQWDYEMHGDRARYIEAAHGIGLKGGQHGTE